MSGICGALALGGANPSQAQIQAMVEPLKQRGPDGTNTWLGGPVAFGHASLATTPEALTESLPLTDVATGCTITADARIDNRDTLIPALGLATASRPIGDGELILRSYLRWGEQCVDHLLGDFAFAIWDPRSELLFCARDHMGIRPLLYCHRPGALFVFGSETDSLLAHELVPATINEGRIADHLDNLEGLDFTSTFYRELFRLPPAHCLKVDRQGLAIRSYWELTAQPELELANDEAYTRTFLEVFTEAVRCRLRSPAPVGAMLSGGLDSSSVAAVAAKLLADEGRGPLPTFSAIGPDCESCVETRTIKAAAALPAFDPTFISHSELDGIQAELIRLTREQAEPFDGHMVLHRAVYLAAHRAGVKVMLDGAGGDIVLYTSNYVAELLRRSRFGQAVHEAIEQRRFLGPTKPAWKNLLRSAWVAFVPSRVRQLRRHASRPLEHRDVFAGIQIDPSFAARTGLDERRKKFRDHLPIGSDSHRELRVRALRHPHAVVGRERYARVASQLAIEPRDPFRDIRVILLALSLPLDQLQADGWPKLVLRRAMEGVLPRSVIWRRGKEHLGLAFMNALFGNWRGWREEVGDGLLGIARAGSIGWLRRRNPEARKALDFHARLTLFYLLCWLRR